MLWVCSWTDSLRSNQIKIILDMSWQADVSLVKRRKQTNHSKERAINLSILASGTNQTNDSTNWERPCSTPVESRKSYQPVSPCCVLTWWVFQCWCELSRRLHSWRCPSVNSFKFQPCDHTLTRTHKHRFLIRCWRSHKANDSHSLDGTVYG